MVHGDGGNIAAYKNGWAKSLQLVHGPAEVVREGLQEWYDAGLSTPILVPSSVNGGQLRAFSEVFDFFHT